MTKLVRLAHIVLALALPLAAGAAPAAPQRSEGAAPGTGSAYAADIGVFLESVHWYERGVKSIPLPSETYQREFLQALLASMTPAQFYAKAAPAMARYITPAQAATLSAMARKRPVPLGQQQAAMQAYWTMEKKIGPELGPVWRELGTAFTQRMEARAVAEVRRAVAELAENRGTPYMPKLNKVGLPYLDRLTGLTVHQVREQMIASDTMSHGCRDAGMETALRAANLLAKDGIAAARQALDGCERALETMEKSSERAFNGMRADLLALNLPPNALAGMLDKQGREFYDFGLKYGELTRQLLTAHRRMVGLVESRHATVQLDGDQLAFESEADVAEFNRNLGEVNGLGKTINDLIYQQRQKGALRNMDLGDDITPATPTQGS
ncbi:hypothetical protein G4G28_22830 [Massilia sp. Dwa41.01b]|uniref:hypothetical protein n=1 Tax=unclassified Massilia TaxID=2609279 RepID=UPI0015FECD08|nr:MULTISPECIES: hypothetical protein [unclassified Massilia]QNA90636.1 hypothetical protein G4G28_22830 [Massilia sp. Dwa41.01b]QNA97866.1 hypothetical protein G4G31_01900 [Massilia sp. Se16.2.3]